MNKLSLEAKWIPQVHLLLMHFVPNEVFMDELNVCDDLHGGVHVACVA